MPTDVADETANLEISDITSDKYDGCARKKKKPNTDRDVEAVLPERMLDERGEGPRTTA